MYTLNDTPFAINAQHTFGDVQYPAGWFLDPANRDAIGVVEVPDPGKTQDQLDAIAAAAEVFRVQQLWQFAHNYEFSQISGSAIGLLTLGVLQGKPKCLAVQNWIKSIWTEYYTRKANGSTNYDFSGAGPCPHSIPELMEELGM